MRAITAGLVLLSLAASAQDFREGQWEFKSTMKMAGMPAIPEGLKLPEGIQLPEGMSMPTFGGGGVQVTNKSCITKESLVPPARQDQQDCQLVDQKISGGKVSWRVECKGEDTQMTGIGKGEYSGTRMTASMQMKGTVHGMPVDSAINTEGRFLGACPAR